jgi:nucleotide-binding universal stress UspA family protein
MGDSPQPRVIVGVDRSIHGLAALRLAVAEARRLGAPLHAVRVLAEFSLEECEEIDAAFADAFGGVPQDIVIRREVLVGPVAEALTRRAHYSTDILVVGTHGHGRWHAFWFGSVSRACLRRARCPVLVVPGPEMAQDTQRGRLPRIGHRRDLWSAQEYETPVARG